MTTPDSDAAPAPVFESKLTNDLRPFRQVCVHDREYATLTGRLAIDFCARWSATAMVCDPPSDDMHGPRNRYMTPDEITDRAIAVAEALMSKLREREHIHLVPPMSELFKEHDAE